MTRRSSEGTGASTAGMAPGGAPYTGEFYERHRDASLRSARAVVPLVVALVRPQSVVDVGCGIGAWLSVFREQGIRDLCGVDGDWVDRARLLIPTECFRPADLRRPLPVDRQFDLAVSLEVGEHLPAECARTLVTSLTRLAPAVLFSAAIPFQGGAGHVNEQWPEYWVQCFAEHGYAVVDGIRRAIWRNDDVEWYYAQNTLLFATRALIERSPVLRTELERTAPDQLSLVHPTQYLEAIAGMRRLLSTAHDIGALIPAGETFILVDHDVVRKELAVGRRVIPFLERDGEYWGPPPDDMTAIQELERLRQVGATVIVFAWPALWWLDHYVAFHDYLRSRFRRLPGTERLVAFDVRG
jgi:SAM-dependent methyltransferase